MSKLYVFGDSWTECKNTQEWHPYVKNYKGTLGKSWPELLAKELNSELFNFGKGGCSFEYITNRLIASMETIEPNSTVVVGGTSATRIFFPFFNPGEEGFTLPIGKKPDSYDGKAVQELLGMSKEVFYDVRNAAIDYAVKVRLPYDYHFCRYYYNNINRILSYLEKTKNIKFTIWNWDEMRTRDIERMRDDKDSSFYETSERGGSHPSFNGYSKMCEIIKNNLLTNNKYIGFTAEDIYFSSCYD